MADVSNNTKKLQELAKALGDTDFDHEVNPRIKALKIEDIAFPLFSGLGDSYEQTRQSAEDAAKALGEVLKALGGTVKSVADYYQRMEEQHGKDFDTADTKLRH
ncbi:hypothetical protein SAMN05421678_12145 [Actinopolymorpha cephalotaxi]|uniref:Excreted virulence factor EspC, type VII ESX diderm n=1 Tax=Actinopolymorpha cephalotaxi TaxID=504797 RepID=A0A1I3AZ21_9ACTN|nr:hypothetical protein [Actinopolymorpha cephalotaxi]NYH84282.1 hypothetical protein [Actinopolymorpha cephalotaxi]SFH55284.1 hypothetical protein SAMN05421678_12145 [Actinopolymorpha cephalotaxi]